MRGLKFITSAGILYDTLHTNNIPRLLDRLNTLEVNHFPSKFDNASNLYAHELLSTVRVGTGVDYFKGWLLRPGTK